jgi:prolyl 4-hydroxylase
MAQLNKGRNIPLASDDPDYNFWGTIRSEQEIKDFVSDAVFSPQQEQRSTFHSTSHSPYNNNNNNINNQQEHQWVDVISSEPPLLIVHGFLEPEHCDSIVQAVNHDDTDPSSDSKTTLTRSTMGASQTKSDERTSSTAWLREENCPLPLRTFASRTSALSGLPCMNMENCQVVRYQPGEEFKMHTDHLDSFNEFDVGGRLATCLVYLNDAEVSLEESGDSMGATMNQEYNDSNNNNDGREEEAFTGGETFFHEFDVAIPPKKGSALFFWNTLERPGSRGYTSSMFLNVDTKLRHAGRPVLSGEKWVANRWIHPRDFGAGVRGLL